MNIQQDEVERAAFDLALALWGGTPLEYKRGYRNIWEQFEGWLYTAAMQNSTLAGFVSQIVRSSGGQIGKNISQRKEAAEIIACGRDQRILDVFRQFSAIVALRVRLERQRERELYEDEG
jgi:hypothetical protein